jgi:flagellar motor switch protein FliG
MIEGYTSPPASRLSGPAKAAAILLTMEKGTATGLLKHLAPDELREVTRAAARLGTVTVPELETVVEEFTADFAAGASLLGDLGRARALLEDVVPPAEMAQILQDVMGSKTAGVWEGIANLPEARLATFLKTEHPLTATFILSKLESSASAKIVTLLPRELRNQVLCQLIAPPTLSPGAQVVLENALRTALLGGAPRASGEENRARIADIINGLDPNDADDVMKTLISQRPQDAKAVKALLFSFNDLPRLPQRARAALFDKVSTDVVVMALRGTDAEFREPVLSAMASRSRRLVEGELASPGAASTADTAKARKEIVDLVLKMAQKGEVELPQGDDSAAA